ncbi:PAS domain-containing protein [Romeriopsis navalis]|uniref:PAS domain-containing protein n=1 Tax=Romeriopsis navalis TaxID=2992132 RepID=UPI0021F87AB9|nr:PAS domain S-box protein [Romeriopsis navalis]
MKRDVAHLFQLTINRSLAIVSVGVVLTLLLFLPLGWSAWSAYRTFDMVIVHDFRLQHLAGSVIHFDEVLTMSARMNAATGESRWEKRYNDCKNKLDAAIKDAVKIAPNSYQFDGAAQTDRANQKLMAIEQESFELVRNGQRNAAADLLFSPAYERQKVIYAQGIQRELDTLQFRIQTNLQNFGQQLWLASTIAALSLFTLLPIWWVVLQVLRRYLKALLQRYLKAQTRSEQALHAAKTQLETVLNTVPANISWVDADGVFMGVNNCLADSLSLTPGEIVGTAVNSLDGNSQLAQFLEEFLLSPKEVEDRRIEIEIKGEPRCYLIGVQKYQQGKAAVSFGIDITDWQQATDSLKIAEEKYRSIFENALKGIFQSAPDGRFISVNPAMAKIHRYGSPDEMMECVDNIAKQIYVDHDRHKDFVKAIEAQGAVKDFEYRSYCKDGSIIWTQIDARVVRDQHNQVLYYEGIVQDITDRIYHEAQLRCQLKRVAN